MEASLQESRQSLEVLKSQLAEFQSPEFQARLAEAQKISDEERRRTEALQQQLASAQQQLEEQRSRVTVLESTGEKSRLEREELERTRLAQESQQQAELKKRLTERESRAESADKEIASLRAQLNSCRYTFFSLSDEDALTACSGRARAR